MKRITARLPKQLVEAVRLRLVSSVSAYVA
jgi:hypothetical protein